MTARTSKHWAELRLAVLAWGTVAVAVWLAVAFATYAPFDAGGFVNVGGKVAAWLAMALVEGFGIGAFALPFFLVFVGWRVRTGGDVGRPLLKLAGVFGAMLALGIVAEIALPSRHFPKGVAPLGGIIGNWVGARMSLFMGRGFGAVIGATALAGAAFLATDRFLLDALADRIAKWFPPKTAKDKKRERERKAEQLKDTTPPVDIAPESDDVDDTEVDDIDVPLAEPGDAPTKPTRRKQKADATPDIFEDDETDDDTPEEVAPPEIKAPIPARVKGRGDQLEVIDLGRKGRGGKYDLPPVTLLEEPIAPDHTESPEQLQKRAAEITTLLADFNVKATVIEIEPGPVVTRFVLDIERGRKISSIIGLADDLGLRLEVGNALRIAKIPGRPNLGVEIPSRFRRTVWMRDLASVAASHPKFKKAAIPIFLGTDAQGNPVIEDLSTMPHLLVAGRTGAGKSVFLNSLILSILMTRHPEDVRLVMVDPKQVELKVYQGIPHLLTRVESNPKKAMQILDWAVLQMEERYEILASCGARNLASYNKMPKAERLAALEKAYTPEQIARIPERMHSIVVIVDEFADLIMAAGKELEQSIARLAQKARAVGIHVVLATQRPEVKVITGLIKANLPSRVAFQVRSSVDSRTIIDRMGAERLLDKGDMLYLSSDRDDPLRVQGPFCSDEEVARVVAYLKEKASGLYAPTLIAVGAGESTAHGGDTSDQDEKFDEAVELVLDTGQASTSWLQRQLGLGYARAGRLMDSLTDAGIVGPPNGSKPRDILITRDDWNKRKAGRGDASASAEM